MSKPAGLLLEDRGVLRIAGADAVGFLQGLVSNDVGKTAQGRAIYAALLTPQGRYLHDLIIVAEPGSDALLIESDRARLADLKRRLALYKLRAKVTIEEASDGLAVAIAWPGSAVPALGLPDEPGAARAWAGGIAYTDPRLAALGARAILPLASAAAALAAAGLAAGLLGDYERLRISLGVPAGGRDLLVEKSILLENGFDELNGVDWRKGCYVGQELTARTKYRGLVKKRLLPVAIFGPLPAPGTSIRLDGAEVGEMMSGVAGDGTGLGLALLRLDAVRRAESGAALLAGESKLEPRRPDWMTEEEQGS
jgi:folate-binding protein YgfZ